MTDSIKFLLLSSTVLWDNFSKTIFIFQHVGVGQGEGLLKVGDDTLATDGPEPACNHREPDRWEESSTKF